MPRDTKLSKNNVPHGMAQQEMSWFNKFRIVKMDIALDRCALFKHWSKWFLIPIHIFKCEMYIYGRESCKKTYKQQPNNSEYFHLKSKNCKRNASLHIFLSFKNSKMLRKIAN